MPCKLIQQFQITEPTEVAMSDGDGYSTNQETIWGTSDTNATQFPENAFRLGSYLDMTFSSLLVSSRIHGSDRAF